MRPCYLIHAKRTPIGKWGGGLAQARIDDLSRPASKRFYRNPLF